MTTWTIRVEERSKTAIKFHLFANRNGYATAVTGPCGLSMTHSVFEDFCMELGIALENLE